MRIHRDRTIAGRKRIKGWDGDLPLLADASAGRVGMTGMTEMMLPKATDLSNRSDPASGNPFLLLTCLVFILIRLHLLSIFLPFLKSPVTSSDTRQEQHVHTIQYPIPISRYSCATL